MYRALFLSFLPLLILSAPIRAEDPVPFADAVLKAAVEAELWIEDPTATDMLQLTSLEATRQGITSMDGLEYATNLQRLVLNNNAISDLSIVSGLTNLEHLDLHNNLISDISAVSGLTGLHTLILRINQISDLSALSGLTNLEKLILRRNQISDISPLSGLTAMRYLQLANNRIGDLSALAGLVHLETLVLEHNLISDISALADLTGFDRLDLQNNPLNEDACAIYIPQIRANNPDAYFKHDPCVERYLSLSSTAGGSVIAPGEGQFVSGDGELVRVEAEADAGYVFVGFAGSYAGTQNPAVVTMDQDHEIQARFASVLEMVYVDDDAPGDPGPDDAAVSDLYEDGTAAHPFDKIQEAIGAAADGASVVVRHGVYRENIDFLGKRIHVTGIDPTDPNHMSYPVLDGAGTGPVVRFTEGEDPNGTLTGFVITGGRGSLAGAILCSASSPTVANCLIVGNRAVDEGGAAIHCTDSHAAFVNCTIADNYGGEQGGGFQVIDSNMVLVNSIVWGNVPHEIVASGRGDPLINYSNVRGGWAGQGNIEADPLFVQQGCWTDPDDPGVVLAPEAVHAVWAAGDYHVQSQGGRWDTATRTWVFDALTSPCIDGGDPLDAIGNEPHPHGGVINMGAYGGMREAGKSL